MLRRASIESIEILVTELFFSVLEILKKPRTYYRLAFYFLPEKSKIDAQLKKIEYHLQEGRRLKGKIDDWELCLLEFKKAFEEAESLKDMLPDMMKLSTDFLASIAQITLLVSIMAIIVSLF